MQPADICISPAALDQMRTIVIGMGGALCGAVAALFSILMAAWSRDRKLVDDLVPAVRELIARK